MKKVAALALIAGMTFGTVSVASAEDFPATPMNHGAPTNLPGETIIPGMTQAMQVINGVTQPILQPILAPGAMAQPAMEPAPMMRRHHSRRMMMKRHMMMKRKMMTKKKEM